MTALAINYIANPFGNLFTGIMRSCEIIGYSRAASELARLGYMDEAKRCILMSESLKHGVTTK